jgi:hypothetical protein
MYKSDKKLLVSGCGISFSGQQAKTWVNILSVAGADIVDVGGPAVSNQWIINRAFLQLEADPDIRQAVIQLTALGKLDVEINDERIKTLVEPDTVRNFTVDDVWPSSASVEHESKQLWQQWLCSPKLEQQDVICKLRLLKHWCDAQQIDLVIVQGYNLHWSPEQHTQMSSVINDIDYNIIDEYHGTGWYSSNHSIDVPVLGFQFDLATKLAQQIRPDLLDQIEKIRQDFARSRRCA